MHKQSVSVIRDAIKSQQEMIKHSREALARLRQMRGTVEDIVRRVLPMLSELRVRVGVYCYSEKPTIRVTISDLPGFKDGRLADVMSMLMEYGFTESRTFDYAEYLNREYYFERGDLNIEINAFVTSDSPTCRRIAVGEKITTQTQYEIECD